MHIHFVQHEIFEAPGAILNWAERRGFHITFSKVFDYQPLPDSVEDIDMLIVMGGPQSPDTTIDECPHFNAEAEISFIKRCIDADKAVLGVCLGAQLIGNALGAEFEHSPEKEIGVFPIQLTDEGLQDKKLQHFGRALRVGHWHGDMPGLTADCKVLATSVGCPRQIIAYSDKVYGFQCHLELTPDLVELLIANDTETLLNDTKQPFIQSPDEIRSFDYAEMNDKLISFLDQLSTIEIN